MHTQSHKDFMNTDFTKDHFMRNRKGPIRNLYEVQLMSNRKGPIRNTLTVP